MERGFGVRAPLDSVSVVRLPSSSVECLEGKPTDDSQLVGVFELNGKRCCLARGPALEVVSPTTGARQGSWRFRCEGQPTITAVCEASLANGKVLLVVGLSVNSGEGLVALFDPIVSRVYKVIKFPRIVTALEGVGSLLESDEDAILGGIVGSFAGCVAVGTQGGYVYLLDIRADDDNEEFNEYHPSSIKLVQPDSQAHDHERHAAKSDGTHLCVHLGAADHVRGSFKYYCNGSDRPTAHVYESDVTVSSLKYMKVCNCLAVGYSIGGFQLFDLGHHKLVAGSSIEVNAPVTHFAYLEPENDPLACFFLWAASAASPKQNLPATLSMYQLFFSTKTSRDDGGPTLYRDMTGMNCRFFHHLNSPMLAVPPSESSLTSRVIACMSLGESRPGGPRVPSEDDNMRIRDMTMMMCVWECAPRDHSSPPDTFMGIFDINHWYNAQMPPEIRSSRSGVMAGVCPYFTFYSMNPVLGSSPDAVLHATIDLSSLSRCSVGPRPLPDNFFWPSAVSFSAKCLTATSVVRCRFLSVQQEVLDDLCQQGAAALVDPTHLVGLCWQAGLLHNMFVDNPLMQDVQVQRNTLLSIALQFNTPNFLVACATTLTSGALSRSGITLRMLVDWARSEILNHKQSIDDLSLPLLDGSGQVSQQQLAGIDYHAMCLQHLTMLFRVLIDKAPSSTTQDGLKSLNEKYEACSLLNQHALTMVWLSAHRMLPEVSEPDDEGLGFVYPYETLCQIHRRSSEKVRQSGQSLMIDLLLERWQEPIYSIWGPNVHGSGAYPPPNIHALLNIFMVICQVPATLHSYVIYYLLLDIALVFSGMEDDSDFWAELSRRYAQAFGMDSHATSLVRGFWALDRGEYDLALRLLTEPCHFVSLIPNQEHIILESFLNAGQHKLAALYLQRVPVSRASLQHIHVSLDTLIANKLIAEAFEYQRRASAPGETELFVHLLHSCEAKRLLHKLSHLPLTDEEEHVWVEFLEQSSSPVKKELLVVYYLQRARYVEAIRLNEKLQDVSDWEDEGSRERAIAREALVQSYCKTLPMVQRQLAAQQARPASSKSKAADIRPVPLSMTISQCSSQGKPLTEAHLISMTMEKITEARSQPVVEATPFKRRPAQGVAASPFIGTPRITPHKPRIRDLAPLVHASPVGGIFEEEAPPLVDQSMENMAVPGDMPWLTSTSTVAASSFMELSAASARPKSVAVSTPVAARQGSILARSGLLSPGSAVRPLELSARHHAGIGLSPMPTTPHSILKVRHISPQEQPSSVTLSPPRSPPRSKQEQAALLAQRKLPLSKLIGEEFHLATPPSVIGRPVTSRKYPQLPKAKSDTPRRIRFAGVEDDDDSDDDDDDDEEEDDEREGCDSVGSDTDSEEEREEKAEEQVADGGSEEMDGFSMEPEMALLSQVASDAGVSASLVTLASAPAPVHLAENPLGNSDEEEDMVVAPPVNHVAVVVDEDDDADDFLSAEEDLSMSFSSSPIAGPARRSTRSPNRAATVAENSMSHSTLDTSPSSQAKTTNSRAVADDSQVATEQATGASTSPKRPTTSKPKVEVRRSSRPRKAGDTAPSERVATRKSTTSLMATLAQATNATPLLLSELPTTPPSAGTGSALPSSLVFSASSPVRPSATEGVSSATAGTLTSSPSRTSASTSTTSSPSRMLSAVSVAKTTSPVAAFVSPSRTRRQSPRRTTTLPTVSTPSAPTAATSADAGHGAFQFTPPNTRAKVGTAPASVGSASRKGNASVLGATSSSSKFSSAADIVFSPPWTRSRGQSSSRFLDSSVSASPSLSGKSRSTAFTATTTSSTAAAAAPRTPPPAEAMDDGSLLASEQSLFAEPVQVQPLPATPTSRTRRSQRPAASLVPTEHSGVAGSEKGVRPPASSTPVKMFSDSGADTTAEALTPGGSRNKRLTRSLLRSSASTSSSLGAASAGASTGPTAAAAVTVPPHLRMTLRRRNQDTIKPIAKH